MRATDCCWDLDLKGSESIKLDNAMLCLLFLTILIFSNFGHADVGVTGTLEYIDNPGRSEFLQSDLMRGISLDAQYGRQNERFSLVFDYSANKEDFEKGIQQDREYVSGAGSFLWNIVPETLTWSISDRRSNQLIEATQPGIPDNEQIVNVMSTGPSLDLDIGGTNHLSLSADYVNVTYDESERFDNEKYQISGEISHIFSRAFSGSVRSSFTDTEYEKLQSNLNYKLSSYSGSLSYERINFGASIEAGEYSVRRKGQSTSQHPLRSIRATYRPNPTSSITIAANESVQDLASDATRWFGYTLDESGEFGEELPSVGSSEVGGFYILDSKSVTYTRTVDSRFNFSLGYRDEDRSYEDSSARNERWKSLSASLGVPLGQRLSISLGASLSEQSFSQTIEQRENISGNASVVFRQSDQLNFSLRIWVTDYKDGNSTDTYNDFDDFGAAISASYRFGDF